MRLVLKEIQNVTKILNIKIIIIIIIIIIVMIIIVAFFKIISISHAYQQEPPLRF